MDYSYMDTMNEITRAEVPQLSKADIEKARLRAEARARGEKQAAERVLMSEFRLTVRALPGHFSGLSVSTINRIYMVILYGCEAGDDEAAGGRGQGQLRAGHERAHGGTGALLTLGIPTVAGYSARGCRSTGWRRRAASSWRSSASRTRPRPPRGSRPSSGWLPRCRRSSRT